MVGRGILTEGLINDGDFNSPMTSLGLRAAAGVEGAVLANIFAMAYSEADVAASLPRKTGNCVLVLFEPENTLVIKHNAQG